MVKIQIIGHLGRDCETNEFNGRTVINFNVASTEKFKNASGVMQERTTWIRCAYWTSSPAVAEYLKKGKLVYAEGTPSASAFKRNDGELAASLEMTVRRVELLGGSSSQGDSGYAPSDPSTKSTDSGSTPESEASEESIDDLPF